MENVDFNSLLSLQEDSQQQWDVKLAQLQHKIRMIQAAQSYGKVTSALGTVLRSTVQNVGIGDLCQVKDETTGVSMLAEVIALDGDEALLLPLGSMSGLSQQATVMRTHEQFKIPISDSHLGKVFNGLGQQIGELTKDSPPPKHFAYYPVMNAAPDPLKRPLVEKPFLTHIKSIDLFLTCAQGQRLAIFAGPGIGKTTFMGMILRGSEADVVVVSLVGERGREVKEFIDLELDETIRKKTVLVVSTSDRPPVEQVKSAYVAQTIAEFFRDQGKKVLLFMDSVTRFARAQREVGLSAGEPATRGGFPPSTFLSFPRLMERAGNSEKGSITAFYTVLMEGEDTSGDPIADEVRSIVDGHILLSKKLAEQNHFPAINILASLSRVADRIISNEHKNAARKLRLLLAKYDEIEFLVRVGEYQKGSDPVADEALKKRDAIMKFLTQGIKDQVKFADALKQMVTLAK